MEEWKNIEGWPGWKISNKGRVMSFTGKIRKAKKDTTGYMMVVLGRMTNKRIHRLVARAFIPNPKNKPLVHHKDFNKLNNDVDNLQWATLKENAPKRESNGGCKLFNHDIVRIRQMQLEGFSNRYIARLYNVHKSRITRINSRSLLIEGDYYEVPEMEGIPTAGT